MVEGFFCSDLLCKLDPFSLTISFFVQFWFYLWYDSCYRCYIFCCPMGIFCWCGYMELSFCRAQPPDYILNEAKNTGKFFKFVGSVSHEESGSNPTSRLSAYLALTEEEYEAVSVPLKYYKCYSLKILFLISWLWSVGVLDLLPEILFCIIGHGNVWTAIITN